MNKYGKKIGNIFESKANTLVNTVNCVGVMGKAVAYEFKKRYPAMYKEYVLLCKQGKVVVGKPYCYRVDNEMSIINFPTKDHWRSPSKLSYIIDGLNWFVKNYKSLNIVSVAFPALGCGNGGLPWSVVGPLMYNKLKSLPIDVEIYAPYGTTAEQITEKYLCDNYIDVEEMTFDKNRISINKYWYLILYVIKQLNNDVYSLNVGRTIYQKICYLLTYVGLPMGFEFKKANYGPYSSQAKQALFSLSNANLISERSLGKMVEMVVNIDFKLNESNYSNDELYKTNRVYDLMSRIKCNEQAEIIATIIYAFEQLSNKNNNVTEKMIYEYVISWKPHWKGDKDNKILNLISELACLDWIHPDTNRDMLSSDDLI